MTLPGAEDKIMDLAMGMVAGDAIYRDLMIQHLQGVLATTQETLAMPASAYERGTCAGLPDEATCYMDPNCSWTKNSNGPDFCSTKTDAGLVFHGPLGKPLFPDLDAAPVAPAAQAAPAAPAVSVMSYERGHCLDLPDVATCGSDPNCQWTERKNGTSYCGAKSGVRQQGAVYEGPMGRPLGS